MPRIGVARLWCAANSFSPAPTTADAFRAREWAAGRAALENARGTATELGGLCEFLEHRNGWEAEVYRSASAVPGAPMPDALLGEWLAEVEEGVRRGEPDGLFLALHGAAMTPADPEADLTILRRLRAVLGPDRPMVATFDLRANLSPGAIALLDGASAPRRLARTDLHRAARRALRLLERALGRGAPRAKGSLAKLGALLPAAGEAAMAEIWGAALEAERRPGILDASPLLGFAWADSPSAGPGVMVWAEEHLEARSAARSLALVMAARRAALAEGMPRVPPGEAIRRAAGSAAPALLLEPADDPMLGGACDAPGLLRALLEAGPPVEAALLLLHDPDAAGAARDAGLGGVVERPLGARLSRAHGAPVAFRGTVERLTMGRFLNAGPTEHGAPVDLGHTAVLRQGRLRVVVTSRREAAGDPACLALHGIVPGELRLLALKAALPPPGTAPAIACDTPGPCAAPGPGPSPFRRVPEAWRS